MQNIVTIGCSHTAGTGLDYKDSYVSCLEKYYNVPILNLSTPGGGLALLEKKLVDYLQTNHPDLIIAQWPNPFRRMHWKDNKCMNETVSSSSYVFTELLKDSEQNFYRPWIQNIINCNTLCTLANINIVNIMLENVDTVWHDELGRYKIKLHVNKSIPGETWLFDSGANDGMHHSAVCHRQWAERLIGLINEYTTR